MEGDVLLDEGVPRHLVDPLQQAGFSVTSYPQEWKQITNGELLALAEQLTTNVDVDDATFEAARAHLSPRELVELVATVAYYNMVARFLIGLRIDLEA